MEKMAKIRKHSQLNQRNRVRKMEMDSEMMTIRRRFVEYRRWENEGIRNKA